MKTQLSFLHRRYQGILAVLDCDRADFHRVHLQREDRGSRFSCTQFDLLDCIPFRLNQVRNQPCLRVYAPG